MAYADATGLNNLAMLAERIESSPERRRPSPVRTPESPQSELTVPPTTHQSVVEALIEQQRKELRSLQLKMQPPATAATVAPTPPPVVARMAPAPSPIAPAVTIRALPQSYSSLAADTAPGALQQTRSEVYALRRATEQLTKLHQQELASGEQAARRREADMQAEHDQRVHALEMQLLEHKELAADTSRTQLQQQVLIKQLQQEVGNAATHRQDLEQQLRDTHTQLQTHQAALETALSLLSKERDSVMLETQEMREWACYSGAAREHV